MFRRTKTIVFWVSAVVAVLVLVGVQAVPLLLVQQIKKQAQAYNFDDIDLEVIDWGISSLTIGDVRIGNAVSIDELVPYDEPQ